MPVTAISDHLERGIIRRCHGALRLCDRDRRLGRKQSWLHLHGRREPGTTVDFSGKSRRRRTIDTGHARRQFCLFFHVRDICVMPPVRVLVALPDPAAGKIDARVPLSTASRITRQVVRSLPSVRVADRAPKPGKRREFPCKRRGAPPGVRAATQPPAPCRPVTSPIARSREATKTFTMP